MKLLDFQKQMKKPIFTIAEAHVVAFQDDPRLVNLQLHQWRLKGALIQLKRGVYLFSEAKPSETEIAQHLYFPCYFSLETALNHYGILPEAVFAYTLVSTKPTHTFNTPLGTFCYRTIKSEAFVGFLQNTLMATPEKALVDYFYLNHAKLESTKAFWTESRLNATELNFKKVRHYAKLFQSNKLLTLIQSFQDYASTHRADSKN